MGRPLHRSDSHHSSCLCTHCSSPRQPDTPVIAASTSHTAALVPSSPNHPTISSSTPRDVPIPTPENILELVSELRDLEQTHRSLRQATQALEATFRRLINSRNTIRSSLDTMSEDVSANTSNSSNSTRTPTMGPGYSALVLSPPRSPTETADSLRSLLDTVEQQNSLVENSAAPDSPTLIPSSQPTPRVRTTRPPAVPASFFGPRHESVRPRSEPSVEQRRTSRQDISNNASTSLGRRVAARTAVAAASGSRTPISDDPTGTRVAELASHVDDAITRLNHHREELLVASDNLRRGPTRLQSTDTDASPAPLPGLLPRIDAGLHRPFPGDFRTGLVPMNRARPVEPVLHLRRSRHAEPDSSSPRHPFTDFTTMRPTSPSPDPHESSSTTSLEASFTSFMANRSPEAQQRLEDFMQRRPVNYDGPNVERPATTATRPASVPIQNALTMNQHLPPSERGSLSRGFQARLNAIANMRVNATPDAGFRHPPAPEAPVDDNGDEINLGEDPELTSQIMRIRAESALWRAEQIEVRRESRALLRRRQAGASAAPNPASPARPPPSNEALPVPTREHRQETDDDIANSASAGLPQTAVRTVIPLSDSDSDWDPEALLDGIQGLRRRYETEDRRPHGREEAVEPFRVSALPLPLVRLGAEPVVSNKRTASQSAGFKSIRVSRNCFAGR